MSKEMRVPTVGESISEVTVGQWFKKEGDLVQLDEVLCELESDKATFEFPAEASGVLRIKAQPGDTVEIGGLICVIEETASSSTAAPVVAVTGSVPQAVATGGIKDMIVPTVGESITEVTLANWIKKDGDFVTLDEIIAEVDSDKATFELPAEATGILRHVAKEGDVLEIGGLICRIEVAEGGAAQASAPASAPAPAVASATSSSSTYASGHASPAASKILAEKGIQTLIHYPIPPNKQLAYKELNHLDFPITNTIHDQVLSLPISPVVTDEEVSMVIQALNSFSA